MFAFDRFGHIPTVSPHSPSPFRDEAQCLSGGPDKLPEAVVCQSRFHYPGAGAAGGRAGGSRFHLHGGAHPPGLLLPLHKLLSEPAEGTLSAQPGRLYREKQAGVWPHQFAPSVLSRTTGSKSHCVLLCCRRDGKWCSGRFYHLKEVCWADPTAMFQRYKQLTRAPDCPVQKPNVLAPFYKQLEGMREFFLNVSGFYCL